MKAQSLDTAKAGEQHNKIVDKTLNWQGSFVKMMGQSGIKNILALMAVFQGLIAILANTLFKKIDHILYAIMFFALLILFGWLAIGSRAKER